MISTELQEEIQKVREKRDLAMQNVFDARERAQRRMDSLHELRARQAFRRLTNPCPGGAC